MSAESSTPILIVDDEWMMVEIITSLLRKLNFTDVDFAANGESALALMRQKAYGLVISDLNMDGMGGLKFLRTVRSEPSLRDTPFIMTTASQQIDNAVAAKHAGVDNYLLKPFSLEVLGRKVKTVLARAALAAELAQDDVDEASRRDSGGALRRATRRRA
jgi:two-component system, chemotaxis family, chemotaxis protein CheY